MPARHALSVVTAGLDVSTADAIGDTVHDFVLAAYRLGTVAPGIPAQLGWVNPDDLLAAIAKRADIEHVAGEIDADGMFAVSAA